MPSVKTHATVKLSSDLQAHLDQFQRKTWTPEIDAEIMYLGDSGPVNWHAYGADFKKRYGWGNRNSICERYKKLKEAQNA